MMIKVLSEGEAVDGGAPSISLIDLTCVAEAMVEVGRLKMPSYRIKGLVCTEI